MNCQRMLSRHKTNSQQARFSTNIVTTSPSPIRMGEGRGEGGAQGRPLTASV